jgi:hypothetical protein
MTLSLKKYSTIGCCGIDCGLCPRFHAKGDSACPGCGGINFKDKHPSCGFVTCCVIKNGLEVCSSCKDYLCKRFDSETKGYDSFVTHKKVFVNLDSIRSNGIEYFIDQQKIRIKILTDFLDNYDDGRSKSFFCISCTLLPLNKLQETYSYICDLGNSLNLKEKNKQLKDKLQTIAESLDVDLKLNNKR